MKPVFYLVASALLFVGCGGGGGSVSDGGVNEAPVIVSADDINTTFDVATELAADAYDPDGDSLVYEWKIDGIIASDAESFAHTFTAGDHTVEFKVTDDEGLSASESFNVHVPVYTRLLKTECFDAADALIYRSLSSYNTRGNLLNTLYDNDGDGAADRGIANIYDDQNREISSLEDDNGDGVPDYISTYDYTEDNQIAVIYIDDNADGIYDSASYRYYPDSPSRKYSGDSRYFPAERIEYDYDADGNIDAISYFKYDKYKHNTEYSESSGDGILNYRITREYDEMGRFKLMMEDYNGDGNIDSTIKHMRTTTTSEVQFDYENDGVIDYLIFMTLDENGNELSRKIDSSNDGNWDRIETYTYDDAGHLLSHAFDAPADGTTDIMHTYTYDASGNLLSHSEEKDASGIPTYIKRYQYDEQGNKINYVDDVNGDGIDDIRCRYSHGGTYPTPMEYHYEEPISGGAIF